MMNWIKVRLTDISNPKQWKNLPVSDLTEEGFLVYGANGVIGYYSEYNHEQPALVVTCRGATCGNLHITVPKSYITSNAMALDDLDPKRIDLRFLFYALKRRGFKDIISGSAQPQITREGLRKISLHIPEDIDYQIRIATILSKAEALIAQRKESLRLLDELLKSTFLEMFGDPVRNAKGWKTLSGRDYSDLLTVGVVVRPASYYTDTGVIALRSLNIKPNRIEQDNVVYFSKEASEGPLAKSILQTGDVVIVRTGKTGTAAVVPPSLNGCNCIDLIIVRPKTTILNPYYLAYLLNSERGMALIAAKEVGGIQKHFNIGAMNKIHFPIPPIELQTQFAQIVEKVEALKTPYQASLEEFENLYGCLSQRAFKGELDLSEMALQVSEDKSNKKVFSLR
jgi:type I restriction enzyme S subunit